MTVLAWTLLAGVAWVGLWGAVLLALRGRWLRRLWREPVLRRPVLVLESDDWGPGPAGHAAVLRRLAATLEGFRDRDGHPAVATLGLVLAAADGERTLASGLRMLHRRTLAAPAFAPLREALIEGEARGVFGLQLHGLDHYWAPALLAAARQDEAVRAWLAGGETWRTEALPAALQSRWTDASVLPSLPLRPSEVAAAVREEVAAFTASLGHPPAVVVPPTFQWTTEVERAWAGEGLRVLVTPGRAYEARDCAGTLVPAGGPILNGDPREGGLVAVVRDAYFEPALGHEPGRGVEALAARWRLGRPALLEMHRFNFVGPTADPDGTLGAVRALLGRCLAESPEVRFLTTEALAEALRGRRPGYVATRWAPRLRAWLARAGEGRRMRWALELSGLAGIVRLAAALAAAARDS